MAGPLTQLCNKSLSGCRRIGVTFDDFAVGDRLSIEHFVTGVISFQGRTIEAKTYKYSISFAEKQNLCVGIVMHGLAVSPCGRSIGANREPIGKQLVAQFLVQRYDHD